MDSNPIPQEQPSLALSDLVLLLNLIKVTAERGAIKAEELSAVGSVYDRLFKFLDSSGVLNKLQTSEVPMESNSEGESNA